jgi:hypothetical protein
MEAASFFAQRSEAKKIERTAGKCCLKYSTGSNPEN